MSRANRTARGALGASVSTVLAAASHSIAGGEISAFAVVATAVFVLPFCVALAGKTGSLWRLSLAVFGSQFFYHWTFSGIGAGGSDDGGFFGALSGGSHAAHFAALERFVPASTNAAGADAMMWLLHACGALITVVLMARGERAVLNLARVIVRALPLPRRIPGVALAIHPPVLAPIRYEAGALRTQLLARSPLSRRGPPCAV